MFRRGWWVPVVLAVIVGLGCSSPKMPEGPSPEYEPPRPPPPAPSAASAAPAGSAAPDDLPPDDD